MARQTKRDRLARIKRAISYPTATEANASRLAAKTAQSIARPLGDVPVANPAPKHLSGAYTRNAIRRVKVSAILGKLRDFYAEQFRELGIVARRDKMNPIYRAVVVTDGATWRNVGSFAPGRMEGTTHGVIKSEPILITDKLIASCRNILDFIPATTLFPEDRAKREWAEWVLGTPSRIEVGKQLSHQIAETRQQSQRVAVRNAAKNAIGDAMRGNRRDPGIPETPALSRPISASIRVLNSVMSASHLQFIAPYIDVTPSQTVIPVPAQVDSRYWNTSFCKLGQSRQKLSDLVPMGVK